MLVPGSGSIPLLSRHLSVPAAAFTQSSRIRGRFAHSSKHVSLNRLTNVIPLRYALSDTSGQVWISDLPNNEENSVSKASLDDQAIPVPAINLDALSTLLGIDRITLLKMNIEGGERMVIGGTRQMYQSN